MIHESQQDAASECNDQPLQKTIPTKTRIRSQTNQAVVQGASHSVNEPTSGDRLDLVPESVMTVSEKSAPILTKTRSRALKTDMRANSHTLSTLDGHGQLDLNAESVSDNEVADTQPTKSRTRLRVKNTAVMKSTMSRFTVDVRSDPKFDSAAIVPQGIVPKKDKSRSRKQMYTVQEESSTSHTRTIDSGLGIQLETNNIEEPNKIASIKNKIHPQTKFVDPQGFSSIVSRPILCDQLDPESQNSMSLLGEIALAKTKSRSVTMEAALPEGSCTVHTVLRTVDSDERHKTASMKTKTRSRTKETVMHAGEPSTICTIVEDLDLQSESTDIVEPQKTAQVKTKIRSQMKHIAMQEDSSMSTINRPTIDDQLELERQNVKSVAEESAPLKIKSRSRIKETPMPKESFLKHAVPETVDAAEHRELVSMESRTRSRTKQVAARGDSSATSRPVSSDVLDPEFESVLTMSEEISSIKTKTRSRTKEIIMEEDLSTIDRMVRELELKSESNKLEKTKTRSRLKHATAKRNSPTLSRPTSSEECLDSEPENVITVPNEIALTNKKTRSRVPKIDSVQEESAMVPILDGHQQDSDGESVSDGKIGEKMPIKTKTHSRMKNTVIAKPKRNKTTKSSAHYSSSVTINKCMKNETTAPKRTIVAGSRMTNSNNTSVMVKQSIRRIRESKKELTTEAQVDAESEQIKSSMKRTTTRQETALPLVAIHETSSQSVEIESKIPKRITRSRNTNAIIVPAKQEATNTSVPNEAKTRKRVSITASKVKRRSKDGVAPSKSRKSITSTPGSRIQRKQK